MGFKIVGPVPAWFCNIAARYSGEWVAVTEEKPRYRRWSALLRGWDVPAGVLAHGADPRQVRLDAEGTRQSFVLLQVHRG